MKLLLLCLQGDCLSCSNGPGPLARLVTVALVESDSVITTAPLKAVAYRLDLTKFLKTLSSMVEKEIAHCLYQP